MVLRNGSTQRDTIVILEGLAGDDDADRELRAAAKRVAELLKKKGR
jgi:predicted outer membrane protein